MFILPWLIGFIIFYARSMIMTAQLVAIMQEILIAVVAAAMLRA